MLLDTWRLQGRIGHCWILCASVGWIRLTGDVAIHRRGRLSMCRCSRDWQNEIWAFSKMTRTRRTGGSGFRFRIPSAVVKSVRNRNRNQNKPKLPTKPQNSLHSNLTNANLEELHVVNTSGPEWRIIPGNRNRTVPKNLQWIPKTQAPAQPQELGPGVRVFTTRKR